MENEENHRNSAAGDQAASDYSTSAMQIYIAKSGQQSGPFSEQQIESMLKSGMVALTDSSWHAGLSEWAPLHQVLNVSPTVSGPPPIPAQICTSPVTSPATTNGAMFFYIPAHRLIVINFFSCGLYSLFWMERNWRYLKDRDGLKIQPTSRAVFGIFYIHALLKAIKTDAIAKQIKQAEFSPGGLASGFIIFVILSRVLSSVPALAAAVIGLIVFAVTPCFLLPVQNYINAINEASPVRPAYFGWSKGQIGILVVGVLCWLTSLGLL